MPLSTLGYTTDRIAEIADQLFDLHDTQMSKPRVEGGIGGIGGWSRKEILGHLIDSANVNHQRVIESQLSGSIVFTGYAHQEWVTLNNYQAVEWEEIVTLWCAINMQFCTMIEQIPSETLDQVHAEHSYETTAFRELASGEPSTLGYLIEDYFAHLQYHIRQIQGLKPPG
ncbi:MAG: hypothetical protein JKY43_11575 [Phycisphaerales bacterium]|nr:hypothetical protein [Phycisphaerales bacterium]